MPAAKYPGCFRNIEIEKLPLNSYSLGVQRGTENYLVVVETKSVI